MKDFKQTLHSPTKAQPDITEHYCGNVVADARLIKCPSIHFFRLSDSEAGTSSGRQRERQATPRGGRQIKLEVSKYCSTFCSHHVTSLSLRVTQTRVSVVTESLEKAPVCQPYHGDVNHV